MGEVCIMAEAPTYQSRRSFWCRNRKRNLQAGSYCEFQERILACWRVVIVWRWR
ncbi:hypothetical protein ACLB1Q_24345 [Escherichia coli]